MTIKNKFGLQFFANDVTHDQPLNDDDDTFDNVNVNDDDVADKDIDIPEDDDNDIEDDLIMDDDEDDTPIEIIDDDDQSDTTGTTTKEEDPLGEDTVTTVKEEDEEITKLRARLAAIESHKDTLKEYDIEADDILEALDQLAALNKGITVEQYKKERVTENKLKKAEEIIAKQEFEQKWQNDLSVLKDNFPECKDMTNYTEIPNYQKWFKFRDAGLTPDEAYLACSGTRTTATQAYGNRKAMNDSKKHLQSVVPKGVTNTPNKTSMTREEYEIFKNLFPTFSDKEIYNIYKKTK